MHATIRGCGYAGLLDEVVLCSNSLNAFVCSYRLFCFPRICGVRAGLALVNIESRFNYVVALFLINKRPD